MLRQVSQIQNKLFKGDENKAKKKWWRVNQSVYI